MLRTPAPLIGALGVSIKSPMSSSRIAGTITAAVSIAPIGIWAIVLFAGTPPGMSKFEDALGFIHYAFSAENTLRVEFAFLAALPVCLLVLSYMYLRATQLTKASALTLLISNLILAALSVRLGPNDLAFFIALPAWWGWRCVREARTLKHEHRVARENHP